MKPTHLPSLCAFLLTTAVLPCQQAGTGTQGQPAGNPPPATGEPVVQPAVRIDSNGWPVVTTPPQPRPVRRTTGTGAEGREAPEPIDPALRELGSEAQPGVGSDGGAPDGFASPAPTMGFGGLADVFRYTGAPAQLMGLEGIRMSLEIRMFDDRGAELGKQSATHEADLTQRDRDRLILTGGRVYGRNGASVFAEISGRPWPGAEGRAARQLRLHGMLARMPWTFADNHRFTVYPVDSVEVAGLVMRRVRVEQRAQRGENDYAMVGPVSDRSTLDQYELICDPDTMQPIELRYTLAESKVPVRVALENWQKVGGVPMPHVRKFLRPDGSVAMEIKVRSADVFLRLGDDAFRPRR